MHASSCYIPSVRALQIKMGVLQREREREFEEQLDTRDIRLNAWHRHVWTDRMNETEWGRRVGREESIIFTVLCIHFQPTTAGHLDYFERYSSLKPYVFISTTLSLEIHKWIHLKDLQIDLMASLTHLSPIYLMFIQWTACALSFAWPDYQMNTEESNNASRVLLPHATWRDVQWQRIPSTSWLLTCQMPSHKDIWWVKVLVVVYF